VHLSAAPGGFANIVCTKKNRLSTRVSKENRKAVDGNSLFGRVQMIVLRESEFSS